MKKFSNLGLFKSKGRIFKESDNEYRTPFQRDKDRIVHSASFRRLIPKATIIELELLILLKLHRLPEPLLVI